MEKRTGRNDYRRLGLYFKENYKQGEPVDVSVDDQEWGGSWIKWLDSRLEKYSPGDLDVEDEEYRLEKYDNTEGDGIIIPPSPPQGHNPPRIRLREKAKNAGSDHLHPGHLEFKVFVQKRVEEALSGGSRQSPRILHRQDDDTSKTKDEDEAKETEKELAKWLAEVIFDDEATSNPRRITSIPDHLMSLLDSLNGISRGKKARKYSGLSPLDLLGDDFTDFSDYDPDQEKEARIGENKIFLRIATETVRALISSSSDSFFDDDPKKAFIRWAEDHSRDEIRKFAKDQGVEEEAAEWEDVIRRLARSADRVMPMARDRFGEIEEMEIFSSGHKLVRNMSEKISRVLIDEIDEVLEKKDSSGDKPFSKIVEKKGARFPREFEEFLVHPSESGKYEGARKKLLNTKKKNFRELLKTGFGKGAEGRTPDETTEVGSRRLAYNIINIMLEEGILEIGVMTDLDILQNQYKNDKDRFSKREKRPTKQTKLVFSGLLLEKIPKSSYRDFRPANKGRAEQNAIFRVLRRSPRRWMYCPPEKHEKIHNDSVTPATLRRKLGEAGARRSLYKDAGKPKLLSMARAGGLLIHDNRTLVSNHGDYSELGTPRCEVSDGTIDALNHLQDVQWEINLDFLEALCDIKLDKGESKIHKFEGWDEKKSTIEAGLIEKDEFREAVKADDRLKAEERRVTLDYCRRIIEHNANVFWHSWNCDFRGRMYPTCSQLSPEGDDFDRAMIRFKHWKELGEEGKRWLFIHTYNLIAGISYDGLTPASRDDDFKRRHDWVEENLEKLREMARLLKNTSGDHDERSEVIRSLGLHEHSPGKSPRFQRMAALLELDRVYAEYEHGEFAGDWSKITSGQPIHLDGSCNGYQHVSCLLRDGDLAEKVNVTKGEGDGGPQDLYTIVADKAKESGYDALYRIFTEELKLSEDQAKTAVERTFSRNVAKAPTMTKVYGAKDFLKSLHGKGGDGDPLFKKVEKTEEERDEEKLSEGQIPKPIIQAYQDSLEYKKEADSGVVRYFEGDAKKAYEEKFEELCKESKHLEDEFGLQEGTLRAHVEKALQKNRRISVWAKGSSLYNALIGPGDEITEAFRGEEVDEVINHPRIESKITRLVDKALNDAIRDATNNAYGNIEDAFKAISKQYAEEKKETKGHSKGKVLHKNSIRWQLEDGFLVRNYYAYRKGTAENNKDRPTKRTNSYGSTNSRLPPWYSDQEASSYGGTRHKSAKRILYRCLSQAEPPDEEIEKLQEHFRSADTYENGLMDIEEVQRLNHMPETAKLWAKIYDGKGPRGKEDRIADFIKSAKRIDDLIDIYLHEGWLDETEMDKIASARLHRDYDLHDFDKKEGGRITKKAEAKVQSSLPPNFVHSLDSLHMRNTINTFFGGQEGDKLGFWAVHDSFGTHACDIDRMREIIRDGFKGIHKDLDLLDRIRPIAESADLELGEMTLRYQCQNSEALETKHKIPYGCSHTQATKEDPKPCNKCMEEYIEIHPDYEHLQRGKFRSTLPNYKHKEEGKTKNSVYKSLGFLDTKGIEFEQVLGETPLDVEEIASSEFLVS